MMSLRYKIDLKNKVFIICIFSFMLMSYTSNAQEKEEKSEVKEETVTETEEVVIQEVLEEKTPDFIPFSVVENVPYPSECKGLTTNNERKKCVVKFMQNHTARKFNSDIAEELGLPAGRKRILSQFKIDKSGKVIEVRVRGPHEALEEELKRVIELLPEFIPGEQKGEKVIVAYTLPIVFTVEEYKTKDGRQ